MLVIIASIFFYFNSATAHDIFELISRQDTNQILEFIENNSDWESHKNKDDQDPLSFALREKNTCIVNFFLICEVNISKKHMQTASKYLLDIELKSSLSLEIRNNYLEKIIIAASKHKDTQESLDLLSHTLVFFGSLSQIAKSLRILINEKKIPDGFYRALLSRYKNLFGYQRVIYKAEANLILSELSQLKELNWLMKIILFLYEKKIIKNNIWQPVICKSNNKKYILSSCDEVDHMAGVIGEYSRRLFAEINFSDFTQKYMGKVKKTKIKNMNNKIDKLSSFFSFIVNNISNKKMRKKNYDFLALVHNRLLEVGDLNGAFILAMSLGSSGLRESQFTDFISPCNNFRKYRVFQKKIEARAITLSLVITNNDIVKFSQANFFDRENNLVLSNFAVLKKIRDDFEKVRSKALSVQLTSCHSLVQALIDLPAQDHADRVILWERVFKQLQLKKERRSRRGSGLSWTGNMLKKTCSGLLIN